MLHDRVANLKETQSTLESELSMHLRQTQQEKLNWNKTQFESEKNAEAEKKRFRELHSQYTALQRSSSSEEERLNLKCSYIEEEVNSTKEEVRELECRLEEVQEENKNKSIQIENEKNVVRLSVSKSDRQGTEHGKEVARFERRIAELLQQIRVSSSD